MASDAGPAQTLLPREALPTRVLRMIRAARANYRIIMHSADERDISFAVDVAYRDCLWLP